MKQLDESNYMYWLSYIIWIRKRMENKSLHRQKQALSQNRPNLIRDSLKQTVPPILLVSTTKNEWNLNKIVNILDRSMDSESKKSGTPLFPFPNTKLTEDLDENRRKDWKLSNMSLHKKQDSMQLTKTGIDKFHTFNKSRY